MTVIATDGITIAADGQAQRGSRITNADAPKIHPRHGRIYALAGTTCMTEAVIAWHHAGADPAKLPTPVKGEWGLLVISSKGLVYFDNDYPYPERVELPFALGCGQTWAIAAMKLGKNPREAVEFAIENDVNCGGTVVEYGIAITLAGMKAQETQDQLRRIESAVVEPHPTARDYYPHGLVAQ